VRAEHQQLGLRQAVRVGELERLAQLALPARGAGLSRPGADQPFHQGLGDLLGRQQELEQHVVNLLKDHPGNQVLLDHFLENAIEAESDSICDGTDNYIIGIMEHIEPAGIHSGDSYAVLPPFDLSDNVIKQIEEHTKTIAIALKTVGLLNIQFAIKDEVVYIIEANPRASRTVPFIAKAYDEPYVNYATKVMLGEKKIKDFKFNPRKKGYAIKIPVFSYEKFPEVTKELGPEMKSTGEAIYFIDDLTDEYFHNIYSERNLYLSK